jgi:hypothetical protein
MIMKVGAALSIAILLVSPCFAQDRASQKFFKEAIEGNFAEVQMGQLAQKQGSSLIRADARERSFRREYKGHCRRKFCRHDAADGAQ